MIFSDRQTILVEDEEVDVDVEVAVSLSDVLERIDDDDLVEECLQRNLMDADTKLQNILGDDVSCGYTGSLFDTILEILENNKNNHYAIEQGLRQHFLK